VGKWADEKGGEWDGGVIIPVPINLAQNNRPMNLKQLIPTSLFGDEEL
jgi:hypothetical protein